MKGEYDIHQHGQHPRAVELELKLGKSVSEEDLSSPRAGLYKKGGKILEFEKRLK